jgi:phytoene synthase
MSAVTPTAPTTQPEAPLQADERAAYLAAQAREHDLDRYLAALFAPPERRDALMALALFNHELARVPDVVSQPMAGYVRYQWWRDAVAEIAAGQPARRHPVAAALAVPLQRGWVAAAPLQALIDARERALEPLEGQDLDGLEAYLGATGGALQAMILEALGGGSPAERRAAVDVGTALGLLGVIRAVGHQGAGQRRPALPPGVLTEAGLRPADLTAARAGEGLGRVTDRVLGRAEALLAAARRAAGRPARSLMAAFLPGVLARMHLAQVRRVGGDPLRAAKLARPATAPLALLAAYLLRRP